MTTRCSSEEQTMGREFDAATGVAGAPAAGATGPGRMRGSRKARVAARLFTRASIPLRLRLLDCLMRPLGTLGAAGVAAGAFAMYAPAVRSQEQPLCAAAVSRISAGQVHELASFVEQVDPDALRRFTGLLAESAVAQSMLGASALRWLEHALRPRQAEAAAL
jgi:hypothetical protein